VKKIIYCFIDVRHLKLLIFCTSDFVLHILCLSAFYQGGNLTFVGVNKTIKNEKIQNHVKCALRLVMCVSSCAVLFYRKIYNDA